MKFGSDVLSRVQHVMAGNPGNLTDELLQGINMLISTICVKNAVSPEDIYAVIVAGNTIMTHFFLGLDVRNIPVSPYIPAVNSGVFLDAREAGLQVNQNAVIYVLPNSGSYVGGDIISGIIFSGIYKEKDPVLFIDVGTNVEVTLGCSDWIMVGAGAAGPALEEGIASIGAKAKPGTICGVKIDRLDKTASDRYHSRRGAFGDMRVRNDRTHLRTVSIKYHRPVGKVHRKCKRGGRKKRGKIIPLVSIR